jgi:hypothetical protein
MAAILQQKILKGVAEQSAIVDYSRVQPIVTLM